MTSHTLVLIPTYNEAGTIRTLIEQVEMQGVDSVLIVDDRSTDGTLDILSELQQQYGNIEVHVRPGKLGFASAVRDGMRLALQSFSFNRLITMDADLSHNPADIPRLLAVDSDVVVGSRYTRGGRVEGWSRYRHLLSRGASVLTNLILRLGVKDVTSGFKAYQRLVIEHIVAESRAPGIGEFQVETLWIARRHGFSIREVPIVFRERAAGRSKLSTIREVYRLVAFLLKARFSRRA